MCDISNLTNAMMGTAVQIISAASRALDDDKRRVRRAALGCKRVWGTFQG